MPEQVSLTKNFLSGGFGGICTVVVGHPMDTIKVRLQTQPKPGPNQPLLFTGTWDCFRKTVAKEGVQGLYKGMGAPLVGVAPIFALSFLGYGIGKKMQQKTPDQKLGADQLFYAGAFSGVFTTLVIAPGERIKCLLQIQHGDVKPKYDGPVDCVKQLYRQGGLQNIFKGTAATVLRDVPASGMYYMTYECLQRYMNPDGKKLGMLSTILAGGCAGIMNWIVCMPADVMKSKFQTAPEGQYKNLRDVFRHMMKEEGVAAFYKGVTPVMLRAFPANAACFFGYEKAMELLNWIAPSS